MGEGLRVGAVLSLTPIRREAVVRQYMSQVSLFLPRVADLVELNDVHQVASYELTRTAAASRRVAP
jgi:hypothetical protein